MEREAKRERDFREGRIRGKKKKRNRRTCLFIERIHRGRHAHADKRKRRMCSEFRSSDRYKDKQMDLGTHRHNEAIRKKN